MAFRLIDITNESLIKIGFDSKLRNDVLKILIDLILNLNLFEDRESLFARFIERENIMSTAIGSNIAIPHVISDKIETPILAIGIDRDGIKYDDSQELVKLVFMFVGPSRKREPYLEALVRTSKILKLKENREMLINAQTPSQVLSIIKELD
jgi:mannitol/fructose-specific phosphotransferase system IIA component (Ntr-type)